MAMAAVYTTVNGMLVHESRGGVESFYFPDTLGSLTTVRSATGVKTYGAEYWPYGEIQTETGTNPSPWSFVGLYGYLRDTASRLYVRARHYRPGLARWQTVDPLWPDESAYGYVGNDPSRGVDPAGYQKLPPKKTKLGPTICSSRVKDVENQLAASCNTPGMGGYFRKCIGQYLPPGSNPDCGAHNGGHGFSGILWSGCCEQIMIDLCNLMSKRLPPKQAHFPPPPEYVIPACLDKMIRDLNGGKNPISDCVTVGRPLRKGECPPGYYWVQQDCCRGHCAEGSFMWPR